MGKYRIPIVKTQGIDEECRKVEKRERFPRPPPTHTPRSQVSIEASQQRSRADLSVLRITELLAQGPLTFWHNNVGSFLLALAAFAPPMDLQNGFSFMRPASYCINNF
jgi:hypothetical protein